jgi:peptide/nickel transport system substrate-binding protein
MVLGVLGLSLLVACLPERDPILIQTPLHEGENAPVIPSQLPIATLTIERPTPTAVKPVITVEATSAPIAPPATDSPQVKSLVICQTGEPYTLFPYTNTMLAAQNVLHAIYENLYTTIGYSYQPQGLVKLPNLADGDAQQVTTTVKEADRVVDAAGNVTTLLPGTEIINAAGQPVVFDGQPVEMTQMVAEFTFRPMVWSDGTPVTAGDSVFSFKLSQALMADNYAVAEEQIERAAAYEATGELSVRWTGLPGWQDPTYFLNVWTPLPEHYLGGIPPEELEEAEESARRPLSSGPFVVTQWTPGDSIKLVRNSYYYRSDEGLPAVDEVIFRFVPGRDKVLEGLLAGDCHLAFKDGLDMSQVAELQAAGAEGLLAPYFMTGNTFEHLDFGVNPAPDYAVSRPDWFEDVRVRQALTMCTDRQRIVDEALSGVSELFHAYVPPDHPLNPADLTTWPYDVGAANTLLDEAGFLDRDGDGLREDPATGTPFQATLITTSGNETRTVAVELVRQNWADCGVALEVTLLPAEEFFAENDAGPLTGRRFDVAMFAWITGTQPPCQVYTTAEIPREGEDGAWVGFNYGGWSHEAFDAACEAGRNAFIGSEAFTGHHQEALRLFTAELPSIPLYARVWVTAARPEVVGFAPDPTQLSEFWNLYAIDISR